MEGAVRKVTGAEPALLGIDLGTSQVKALLCGRGGDVLGTGIAGYRVQAPRDGWAETSPDDWWHATAAAVTAAVGERGRDVAGLAVAGQMHGVVLTGGSGAALRPAILWLDRRSAAEAGEYLRLPAGLRAELGNPPAPGMAGPIAAWAARHEPQTFRQARWLLQPKDWLRFRLTGEVASDPTDASGTLLYDIGRGRWAVEVAEAMGLRADLLPPIRQPADIAGTLQPAAASQLGLPAGLPVCVGAADTAASVLAAALPGPDWGMLTLGSGGQWVVPVAGSGASAAAPAPSRKINVFCAADGGRYRLAAVQNAGVTLGWVTSVLRSDWPELYATAAAAWRPDTPVFLPYLASERGDEAAAAPGGAWQGLTLAHGRADLLRAALEGVAFLLRSKLDELRRTGSRPGKIVIAGGGSRDPAWRRLLADVLALPLYAASTPWLSVRGATLIAGVAAGLYPSLAGAASHIPPAELAAAAGRSDAAEERYRRFRELGGSSRFGQ